MNAKRDDYSSIQEIHDVIVQTNSQLEELGFTRERFLNPADAKDELISEGIINRVLRVTEEVVHVSDETARECGFDRRVVAGVRNRLAHSYGEVDREILWQVVEEDFDALLTACLEFGARRGVEL